ncbi:PEGA domain-containing protein [Chondromyces crocatus]|uniref:PEGA domain-containing protein n=1 Tax=Chondromyces crocatus TaxID=52 RepID=A0A0K1EKK9_CHOCO|nr:PEGA domain-containing protein [Chondromyces crocatus]AKT41415.1 uncharacterized protein CMC5_056150 [Chondromyces crocatus]
MMLRTHRSRTIRTGLHAVLLCLALPLVTPTSAMAQGATVAQPTKAMKDEAATRFKKGLELFKEADYVAALVEFRRAYELVPSWQVLYNIGQVQYQLQDYANSLQSLERYLAEGGRQVPATRRSEVENDLQTLKGRIAFVEITVNVPDAEIVVDDTLVGTSPLGKALTVNAGRRRVGVSREGYQPQTRVVEVASGDTAKASFELLERGAATPATPAPGADSEGDGDASSGRARATAQVDGNSSSRVPWIGWGITGGLAAGAAVFGVLALGASSDLQDLRGTRGVSAADLSAASSKATTMSVVTDALAGAALIAGGVSLYFTLRTPPSDSAGNARASSPGLQLGISPRGAQLVGSF